MFYLYSFLFIIYSTLHFHLLFNIRGRFIGLVNNVIQRQRQPVWVGQRLMLFSECILTVNWIYIMKFYHFGIRHSVAIKVFNASHDKIFFKSVSKPIRRKRLSIFYLMFNLALNSLYTFFRILFRAHQTTV